MDYQDFVLHLDRAAEGGFAARVLRSPAGEAEAPFVNPVSPSELDGLWRMAYAARQAARGDRDLRPETPAALAAELSLEALGDRLFKALFHGPVHGCWLRSLAEATRSPEGGLRLKLQVDPADPRIAPLAELPWEYLYSLEHGGFLGLQRRTPILRHLRLPIPGGRPPAGRPLRLLSVLSQPASLPRLLLEDEEEKIAAAWRGLGGVETLPLRNPTVEALREELLRREVHILHFMGHGGYDPGSGQGVLFFTDGNGSRVPVTGALLASHLAGLDSLRLVFLNACETARAGSQAPFAGVATALLRAGVPAVLAMQRPIRDGSALEFSRTVYRRLAAGDPIDAAVTEGRLAIARGHGALLEWGTPVLFSRAEDGRLFAPASASRRARRNLSAAVLLAGAVAAGFAVKQWLPLERPRQPQQEPEFKQDVLEPTPPTSDFEDTDGMDGTDANDAKPSQEPPVEPEPVKPPPPPPSTYSLSEGSSVSIPGLGAEVGANFHERAGHSFARFWVTPSGEGMLQAKPVVGPGSLELPAGNGTWHLSVLSLDLAEKTARVRLRFAPFPD